MTEAIYSEVAKKTEDLKEKRRFSVSGVLKQLGVSRSGYLAWLTRATSKQQQRKEEIQEQIQELHNKSHQIYGAPKIAKELRKNGVSISERTVGVYMKELGIRPHYIKPYIATTINPDFSTRLENILNEQFNPEEPNAIWCSDITYIWTMDGFVYLTSIMDLFSRKIIAWTLSTTLEVACVIETIEKAKIARDISRPLIFHSDRGSQYVSCEFQKATEKMQNSYSKKAYPWDNACIESFHALIKREWLYRFKIQDYQHAYRLVFEYIEAFYNTVRIHSHCNYLSPDQYESEYNALIAGS